MLKINVLIVITPVFQDVLGVEETTQKPIYQSLSNPSNILKCFYHIGDFSKLQGKVPSLYLLEIKKILRR